MSESIFVESNINHFISKLIILSTMTVELGLLEFTLIIDVLVLIVTVLIVKVSEPPFTIEHEIINPLILSIKGKFTESFRLTVPNVPSINALELVVTNLNRHIMSNMSA
jgi:hypothetical protein